jgi:hypothetical protein
MSDQGLSAENSPGVVGPEAGTGTAEQQGQPEIDWQKRYTDTQAEYSRGQQELADFRHKQELYDLLVSTDDPDTRRTVAEQLGYVLEEENAPESEFDPENPFAQYDERIERLEATLTQRDQREREDAYAEQVRQACDERLDALGIDKDDQDWVLAYAINALPVGQDGLPDIAQAHAVFNAREDARQKRWAQTKRQAPRISPNGQTATEVPNLDNRQERVDWMAQRWAEGQQA